VNNSLQHESPFCVATFKRKRKETGDEEEEGEGKEKLSLALMMLGKYFR